RSAPAPVARPPTQRARPRLGCKGASRHLPGVLISHDPPRYPLHDRHRDGVAHHAVAGAVSHHLAVVAVEGPVVREALEPLTLTRGEPADQHAFRCRVGWDQVLPRLRPESAPVTPRIERCCHDEGLGVLVIPRGLRCRQCLRHQEIGLAGYARWARRSSAACKEGANRLPRLAARRSIPEAAFGLKEYRCRCSPVSKISDNEDATAPLWYSGPLSVQHSIGVPIPQLPQRPDDGSHVPSSVTRQEARDVLNNDPGGT